MCIRDRLEAYASEKYPDGLYPAVIGQILNSNIDFMTKEEAELFPPVQPEEGILMETDRDTCTCLLYTSPFDKNGQGFSPARHRIKG